MASCHRPFPGSRPYPGLPTVSPTPFSQLFPPHKVWGGWQADCKWGSLRGCTDVDRWGWGWFGPSGRHACPPLAQTERIHALARSISARRCACTLTRHFCGLVPNVSRARSGPRPGGWGCWGPLAKSSQIVKLATPSFGEPSLSHRTSASAPAVPLA